MVTSRPEMSVRVRKGGFMANLLLSLNLCPNVVSETLELYIYIYIYIVRPSRRRCPPLSVRSVVPSSSSVCPSVSSSVPLSVRPSSIRPVVVVRPLSVRPSNYYLHDVA